MHSSSEELHPASGARFVFTRRDTDLAEGGESDEKPPSYVVEAHLAGGRTLSGSLSWDERGQACLEPEWDDAWAREEALKLARVLKADPKRRLLRWRGPIAPR